MTRFFSITALLAAGFFLLACGKSTPADPCNPEAGRFIHGQHYISDELLNEEGKFNYKAWVKLYRKNAQNIPAYECIPLQETQSMEEKIQEQKENANLLK